MVVSGRIGLRLAVPGVALRTILTLEDGDIFGWSALLPGSVATSMAVALTPTTAVLFERNDLAAAMTADCELAAAVHERVLPAVARHLQRPRSSSSDSRRC